VKVASKVWYDCGACGGTGLVQNPADKNQPPVECPSCSGKGGRWIDTVKDKEEK